MKNNTLIMCLFLATLCFQACEKSTPDPINVVTLDQDFELIPSQSVDGDGSSLQLIIRSLDPDPCLNAVLDAEMETINNKISVTIKGNTVDGPCEAGEIYTERIFDLPSISGTYEIEFIKGELLSTSGTLDITDTDYHLNVDNLGGLFVAESSIVKIPDNLAWGYIADLNPTVESQEFLEEFGNEFESGIPVFENLTEGNYDLFSVDADGSIVLDDVKLDHRTFAFLIESPEVWEKIEARLSTLSLTFSRLGFQFTRWDGISIQN